MCSDNALAFTSKEWRNISRRYWIKETFTEPYSPHQNRAERMIGHLKAMTKRLMTETGNKQFAREYEVLLPKFSEVVQNTPPHLTPTSQINIIILDS